MMEMAQRCKDRRNTYSSSIITDYYSSSLAIHADVEGFLESRYQEKLLHRHIRP